MPTDEFEEEWNWGRNVVKCGIEDRSGFEFGNTTSLIYQTWIEFGIEETKHSVRFHKMPSKFRSFLECLLVGLGIEGLESLSEGLRFDVSVVNVRSDQTSIPFGTPRQGAN